MAGAGALVGTGASKLFAYPTSVPASLIQLCTVSGMNLWPPAANQSYLHPTYFQNHHDNLSAVFSFLTNNGLTGIFANIIKATLSNTAAGFDKWMTEDVTNWMYRGIVQTMNYTNVSVNFCTAGFVPSAASIISTVGNDTTAVQNGALYCIKQMLAYFASNDSAGARVRNYNIVVNPDANCTTSGGQHMTPGTAEALIAGGAGLAVAGGTLVAAAVGATGILGTAVAGGLTAAVLLGGGVALAMGGAALIGYAVYNITQPIASGSGVACS